MNSSPPSSFVSNHIDLIRAGGRVLDLACGDGRHTRMLLEKGFEVTAVDINVDGISDLSNHPRLMSLELDMELAGNPWPLPNYLTKRFDGIIVPTTSIGPSSHI